LAGSTVPNAYGANEVSSISNGMCSSGVCSRPRTSTVDITLAHGISCAATSAMPASTPPAASASVVAIRRRVSGFSATARTVT
jgi:hypothetical protein